MKSEAELDCLRKAAKLAVAAMGKALEAVGVGKRQCDVVPAALRAALGGVEEFGGDLPSMWPVMPSGTDAGAAHLT